MRVRFVGIMIALGKVVLNLSPAGGIPSAVEFPVPNTEPFDRYSDAYDEWFRKNPDLYTAELEVIRQLIPPPGTTGLEVGVGSGKFAEPLRIKVGIEPSINMAIRAKRLGIRVCSGVAEDLPFPDDRFDFVLLVTTICFVDDMDRSFRETFRVLKPGGCIIVGFVDKESEMGGQYAEKKETSRFYREATFFSAQEVLKHLQDARFTIEVIKQTLIPGEPPDTILDDFGRGSFIAVKGTK